MKRVLLVEVFSGIMLTNYSHSYIIDNFSFILDNKDTLEGILVPRILVTVGAIGLVSIFPCFSNLSVTTLSGGQFIMLKMYFEISKELRFEH